MRTRFVALSIIMLVGGVDMAHAGWISLATTDDGYGRGGSYADANYNGGDLSLKYDTSLSFTRKAWIQFDTSTVTTDVLDASLDLTSSGSMSFDIDVNVYGLNDGVSGESWDESTLTWNNAPGNDTGSRTGVNSDATLLGTLTIPGSVATGDVFSFSGTALTDFLNADTNGHVSFILISQTPSSSFGVTFASKESATLDGPELRIDAVPEPASLALFSMGGLILTGCTWCRRRREHPKLR